MSTVSLAMIIKDEYDKVCKVIEGAYPFFDQLVFTVSDETTARKLEDFVKEKLYKKVEVYYRPWNNRFDEARNENFARVTSEFVYWQDADDTFNFNAIPTLLEIAEEGNYDQIMLPYNYAQDDQGNCIAYHWRERLMRTSHPFTWKGWVHETPISDQPFKSHQVNVEVVHNSSDDHVQESLERNHAILLEATAASDDPRYKMYLGTSFFSLGKYGEAVEILDKFIKVSGNGEDIYRSLCCMSECAMKMGSPNAAMQYAMQAAAQIPEYPMAYRLMAQWEDSLGNWDEGLEWAKTAASKPNPEGMGVYDPSSQYDVFLIATHCEFMRKNYNKSLRWLRRLPADHPARVEMEDDLRNEADAETFVTLLPKIRQFFESEEALYTALCHDMKYDSRLRGLRDLVVPPKTWSDNSIVFLCGEGYEEWGPHTLDKGMGGSEEAVVYLSRELVNMGWEVTVYGAVDEEYIDKGCRSGDNNGWDHECETYEKHVTYLPWKHFNKEDNFNVFVGWRAPEFTEYIKAKVKIADIHDLIGTNAVRPYPDVTYFFKSQYHKDHYPDLPDEKSRVIGNGIVKEQFNG